MADAPDSVPMWSYYADGHKGVCLRFRVDDAFIRWAFGTGGLLIKVHYSHEYPHVNFFEASDEELARALIGTKAIEWKHEGEWRLVMPATAGPVAYPRENLDGIILGARAGKADRDFVRKLVGERTPRPLLFNARPAEASFALKIEPEG